MRIGVNASVLSVFGLFYAPFAAMASAMYRDQMIVALYDDEGSERQPSPSTITGQADK
jgi:hypothetical protein